MGKNVTMPLPLLKSLVVLLEFWDVSLFDRAVRDDYWDALWALKIKLIKLDLREVYSMIFKAPDEDARHPLRALSTYGLKINLPPLWATPISHLLIPIDSTPSSNNTRLCAFRRVCFIRLLAFSNCCADHFFGQLMVTFFGHLF